MRKKFDNTKIHPSTHPPAEVCPPERPHILDAVQDQNGDRWIRYGTSFRGQWFSLADLAQREKEVFGRLSAAGITILTSQSKNAFKQVIEAHTKYRPGLIAAHPGWTGGHYVLGDGSSQHAPAASNDIIVAFETSNKFTASGTLKGWIEAVGPIVTKQSLPLFTLAYSFVAPLLRFAPPYILNPQVELVGRPECGKSTLGVLAASVWAGDPNSEVGGGETWDVTVNAIDRTKVAHSDSLLFLDEGNLAGTNSKDQKEMLHKSVFKMSSNGSRRRYTKDAAKPNISVALLSTSNEPLLKLTQATGRIAAASQSRMITIEIDAQRPHRVFDEIPAGFTDAKQAIERLRCAVNLHYGLAGRAFVGKLVDAASDEAQLRRRIEKLMRSFLKHLPSTGQESGARVANVLALTYAAGRLAREWGIFPAKWGPLRPALIRVFGMIEGTPPSPRPAIHRIREYRDRHRASICRVNALESPLPPLRFKWAYGFVRKRRGRSEILIPSLRFRRTFADADQLIREFKDAGLAHTEGGKTPKMTIKVPRRICESGRAYCITLD